MSIKTSQEQFAWKANKAECQSFEISEVCPLNTDRVVMRPSIPAMSSKQNVLDEEAVLRSKRAHFLNESEIPNYEQSMMNDKAAFEERKKSSQKSAYALEVLFKSKPESHFIKTPTLHMSRQRYRIFFFPGIVYTPLTHSI